MDIEYESAPCLLCSAGIAPCRVCGGSGHVIIRVQVQVA